MNMCEEISDSIIDLVEEGEILKNNDVVCSSSSENELCVFCAKLLTTAKTVSLGNKGIDTINNSILSKHKNIKVNAGQKVHRHCRLQFYKDSCNTDPESVNVPNETQSRESNCTEKNICIFCGCPAKMASRKRGNDVHQVKTEQFQSTIEKLIDHRQDNWANDVKNRIGTKNLQSEGVTYHQRCNLNFRKEKQSHSTAGRPQNELRQEAFLNVVKFMEQHEGEAFTIKELLNVMKSECSDQIDEYGPQFFKSKLMDHFGDEIYFMQSKGRPDYVLFRHSANSIVSKFYESNKKGDNEYEKKKILETATKLILSDILTIEYNKSEYPTAEQISDIEIQKSFVPDSLLSVLSGLIKAKNSDLKIAAIGQAICQAVCPRRILAPLQIALGVHTHYHTGSKYLVQTLFQFGYCSSYDEVQKFELCAAISVADECLQNTAATPNQVIKYVGDNADHDSRTIDGKNTFHGMGMISITNPFKLQKRVVKRTKPSIEDLRSIGTVKICQYLGELSEKNIIYGDISELTKLIMDKTNFLLNITWKDNVARPSWSGVMQSVSRGEHPGKSSINILPMIDLNASDPDCVFSTLMYIAKEAHKQHVTPVATFDLPLFWKAQTIKQNEPESSPLKNIVLLLGGFHTQMSFIGCIGHFFEGLGLQEILETVYATNSVPHMLSGKSYSRAVRGYFLVDIVLNTLLTEEVRPQTMSQLEWEDSLIKAEKLYDDFLSQKVTISELESSTLLQKIQEERDAWKQTLSCKSRTAKAWLQFMDMVQILKNFIKSERTGNWLSHLDSLRRMLPYFAAAGHNSYAKCGYIYLQEMLKLKETHPDVYDYFCKGLFVDRRSNRYWAALACDLLIEQCLMRSLKSQQGLTRGRGIGENQRLIWINSMPECVEIKNAIEELTGLHYETSEQHKDLGTARQERDLHDARIIYNFMKDRNPFKTNEGNNLRNIYNGIEANARVNVDIACEIGEKVISSMKNQNVADYVFKQANQAIIMNTRNTVIIDGQATSIDPQLLFQRLILISRKMSDDQLEDIFRYELSQRPSALFDEFGYMRNGSNSSLPDTLRKIIGSQTTREMHHDDSQHILAGEFLLNKISWTKNETYEDICSKYVRFALQYKSPIIVFEEYSSEASINDESNFRQSKGLNGVTIAFTAIMPFNGKKELFLTNLSNKHRFTNMLAEKLRKNGCGVIISSSDPKVTISQCAISSATSKETIVISDDVELLYVLCSYYKTALKEIFLKLEGKGKSKMKEVWNMGEIHSVIQHIMPDLPFVNAIGGCKTTSETFGIGKGVPLKKIVKDNEFRNIAKIFSNSKSTSSEIIQAGDKVLVMMYNGKRGQKLNALRYEKFNDKVAAGKTSVSVQSLPPTEAAAKYHHLRVFLQTQIWLGNDTLDPLDYGWTKVEKRLFPKTTDLEVAPAELLSVIRCGCKGDCSNKKCTCRRHDMLCSVACTECRVISCLNSSRKSNDENNDFDLV